MTYRKKLIEVALPLDAINAESAREKSIRHGHPSTLHLWWARRPLAACRAVLFAQMVDDPASHPERFPTEAEQTAERERLFDIIRELVLWENVNNEKVLEKARAEIRQYAPPEGLPPVLDPFAGGGSIPLEAQRLGLEAHASDLNPVAVLINKALIEIPPKFANLPPVNPESRAQQRTVEVWRGAQGLAEDVRYYGRWMRDEAEKRIGHLYPKATITAELLADRPDLKQQGLQAGDELTVIAWLWARTVPSPNPAANGAHVPLVRSFLLSRKKGNEAWVEMLINQKSMTFDFVVHAGKGKEPKGTIGRSGGFCIFTRSPMPFDYIKEQGQLGNIGTRLMAVVAEGTRGRIFLPPESQLFPRDIELKPGWIPSTELSTHSQYMSPPRYGMIRHGDLFTDRQLIALNTFIEILPSIKLDILNQAESIDVLSKDKILLSESGKGAIAYAEAVVTYLALSISKASDLASSLCRWQSNAEHLKLAPTFSRHALSMSWDFAEGNPFSDSSGNFLRQVDLIAKSLEFLPLNGDGHVIQHNALSVLEHLGNYPIVSTDPPYYDNVPYADLSDFFYIWLRQALVEQFPNLFVTLLVPKSEELVADHVRHGDRETARNFFEKGLNQVFLSAYKFANPNYPISVYYAFRQTEATDVNNNETAVSTGWEAMLESLTTAGFSITGTWPMRTERPGRLRETGSNALASSIVLVCRPRPTDAPRATRRDFLNALRRELPAALKELQQGNIAPVDLAQASIGPGMAIFSRYSQVLEADGAPMRVRTALALINQALDEYLSEQEGAYDSDTRWALAWFEQNGFSEGPYGDAETLSTAKNTSVNGMVSAGFLQAAGGKVRLLRRDELPADWNPHTDKRLTVWEVCQQLIRTMEEKGETAAAQLLTDAGPLGDAARDLAYRLYQICERKGWAQEALPYNALIISWSEMGKLSRHLGEKPVQSGFDF